MDWGFVFERTFSTMIGPEVVIYALAALGLNIHFGYTGLLNFGHVAFMAAGAYGLGVAPYTYLWSNGTTGSTITGLTEGSYSVQITDSKNCQVTQSATVTKVDPIGFGSFTATTPPANPNATAPRLLLR